MRIMLAAVVLVISINSEAIIKSALTELFRWIVFIFNLGTRLIITFTQLPGISMLDTIINIISYVVSLTDNCKTTKC